MSSNYILITCVKNEEKFLPTIIESVISNDIKPILWVFINDLSTDNSVNIIKMYSERYEFIKFFTIENKVHIDILHGRFGYLCNLGFKYAIEYCNNGKLDWEYMGMLDADTKITKYYFSNLIEEMNKDKKLGIVSGECYSKINDKLILVKTLEEMPNGTGRIIRKKCLFDINMYKETSSPDTISSIKANFKGWKTKIFKNFYFIQLRETYSKNNLWNGYIIQGKRKYNYNYHPLLIFFNIVDFLLHNKFYLTLPFINGYLTNYLTKKPREVYLKLYLVNNSKVSGFFVAIILISLPFFSISQIKFLNKCT